VVKPAVRRKQVQHLVSGKLLSERRACGLVGISRSVVQYNGRRRCDASLRLRLKELAERYPRYGYLMLHAFLKQERLVQNAKRTYRLYTEEGLQVRTKKRRKLPNVPRQSMALPSRQTERWSLVREAGVYAILCQNSWRQVGASAPSILWMITPASVSANWLIPPSQASGWRLSWMSLATNTAYLGRLFWTTARSLLARPCSCGRKGQG